LKYLLEDILHKKLDFSFIKSNNTILNYKPCQECDIFILIEDPSRSLILNVCGNVIHQTYVKDMLKDETLIYLCDVEDVSNPLLSF